ncbi:MAG: helix-turn-helix domain-containing protein [Alphaproteobacteria bacterium]|nr:helix-turn-helix domain-containing protein [Alphaproteobacteria bacterium]
MDTMREGGSLIDARTLARHLGVSLQAVYRLSASGRIKKYVIGHRTIRFRLDEVLEALAGEEQVHQSPSPAAARRTAAPAPASLPPFDWSKRS